MLKRVLVVGFGNPLRRDDGVGIQCVERLQATINDPPVTFLTMFQPLPELVEWFKAVDKLILVDASADLPAGVIERRQITCGDVHNRATHTITIHWLLSLCNAVYGCAPETVIFTIGGLDFGYGEGLSAMIELRLNRLVEYITEEIQAVMEVGDYA